MAERIDMGVIDRIRPTVAQPAEARMLSWWRLGAPERSRA